MGHETLDALVDELTTIVAETEALAARLEAFADRCEAAAVNEAPLAVVGGKRFTRARWLARTTRWVVEDQWRHAVMATRGLLNEVHDAPAAMLREAARHLQREHAQAALAETVRRAAAALDAGDELTRVDRQAVARYLLEWSEAAPRVEDRRACWPELGRRAVKDAGVSFEDLERVLGDDGVAMLQAIAKEVRPAAVGAEAGSAGR